MARKSVAVAVATLVVAVGVDALAAAEDSADLGKRAAKTFKPKKFAGEWAGQYTNTTFGTTGPAEAIVVAPGKKFGLTLDLGGNVFGCPDPPQGPQKLIRKGKGPNTWGKKGFNVSTDTPALGHVDMTYKFKSKALTGTGAAPPCLPGVTYTFNGTLTTTQMQLAIEIDLGGGQTAHSDLVINKQ